MYRPRLTSVVVSAPALLMLTSFIAGCSSPPEEPLLRQFFRASSLRDNATLSNFAAAEFDARTDGVVSSFDIVSVTEERREPLRLKEFAMAHDEAQATDDEFGARMRAYQDENLPAIERVLKAESAQSEVARRDREVQETWQQWRDEAAASAKGVSDARTALNGLRPLVELSVQNIGDPLDVTAVEGEMVSKDVAIDAQVRPPDSDDAASQQLVITIQRAVLTIPGGGEPLTGRWIITRIQG